MDVVDVDVDFVFFHIRLAASEQLPKRPWLWTGCRSMIIMCLLLSFVIYIRRAIHSHLPTSNYMYCAEKAETEEAREGKRGQEARNGSPFLQKDTDVTEK